MLKLLASWRLLNEGGIEAQFITGKIILYATLEIVISNSNCLVLTT